MVEINLLPQQDRARTQPSAWRYATVVLPIVTAAGILIPEVMTATTISNLHKELDQLNGEITTLTPAKNEFDALSTEKRNLMQTTAIAQQLASGKSYWSNDIASFTRRLPQSSGVAVKTMTIKPMDATQLTTNQQSGIYVGKSVTREIDITGQATGQQAVVNFLNTYENDPNFGVNFKSMQKDGETSDYTFSATVGVVGAAPTPAPGTPGAATPTAAPAAPPAAPASGGQ